MKLLLFGSLAILCSINHWVAADERPNVVLIICDDLNDYVEGFEGHPQTRTPSMKALAKSGVSFDCAYSNNPVCAPSRSSFLTGIYPHTSGNLFWGKWFENPVLKNSKTIMEHFRDNGYHVAGSGKLMHHGKPNEWSNFKYRADYGPSIYDGNQRVAHPDVPMPFRAIGAVDGSFAPLSSVPYADDGNPESGWIYGNWKKRQPFRYVSENDRDPTPDERNAKWAADQIRDFADPEFKSPFFLGIGLIRPHTPIHVPKKFFDLFPLEDIQLPVTRIGDAEDTYYTDVYAPEQKGLRYYRTLLDSYPTREDALKAFTQAYLAGVAAVDECIGEIVDAIDSSPDPSIRNNTIIVVTSDHGWNMGEKDYLFKNSPWEESTRVPFIIRTPGLKEPGLRCQHPISLIDLYPTLIDLCALDGDTRKNKQGAKLDGHSIRPLIENPQDGTWEGPDTALSMIFVGEYLKLDKTQKFNLKNQNWSIRSADWRYIRYRNGSEELYDHNNDPHEWNNLASHKAHQLVLGSMRARLNKMVPELQINTQNSN